MTLDTHRVGQVVAEHMEDLEALFREDYEIGNVCTIVEVVGPHGGTQVSVRSNGVRRHALLGLLRTAEAMTLTEAGTD